MNAATSRRSFSEPSIRWGLAGLPPIFARQLDLLARGEGRFEDLTDAQLRAFLSPYTWAQWPRIAVVDLVLIGAHLMISHIFANQAWLRHLVYWLMMVVPFFCAFLVFSWYRPRPKYRPARIWWIRNSQLLALMVALLGFFLTELLG